MQPVPQAIRNHQREKVFERSRAYREESKQQIPRTNNPYWQKFWGDNQMKTHSTPEEVQTCLCIGANGHGRSRHGNY